VGAVEVVYQRCCGLDIHKKTVVACLIIPGPNRKTEKVIRTFGTLTDALLALADWLAAAGCTHVALESTGVDWQPVWNSLEEHGGFELRLVKAQHRKATSADYPHRQHGLSRRDGHGYRPGAAAVRTHLRAG
jgi:transposase